MPMAAAMMPPSAIGVSRTRCSPYFLCSPSVTRNTPPKKPTSSPRMTTRGSRSSITSIAELSAWTMFMRAMLQPFLATDGALCGRSAAAAPRSARNSSRWRTIRHVLDQGRAAALARALRGPLCHRVHRQEIVAVDANPRYAVTGAALREGLVLTTCEALEGGDGPLVVDQVENHRRLVHGGEVHRVGEARLRARALADPAGGNAVFALDGCGHRPADRLGKLRGEVAGDGEDVAAPPVVHDGHLPALAHVVSVRQTLTHELDQVAAAHDVQALLPIRGEQHVPRLQGHALRHRHRLFAGGLDIEGDAPLPLDLLHAVVEQPCEQHVAQGHLQLGRLQVRIPGPDGPVLFIEHAHHLQAEVLDVAHRGGDVRAVHRTCRGYLHVAEIRFLPRPCRLGRNVQARPWGHEVPLKRHARGVAAPSMSSARL